jgi:acyl dehydratase
MNEHLDMNEPVAGAAVILEALSEAAGLDLGVSRWVTLDQARIDAFADVTEDFQWIHVDATQAAEGPYGTTIAHGYLTISVVGTLLGELLDIGPGITAVNYGLNRLRFPAPVRSGSRIRAAARIETVTETDTGLQLEITVTGELEGSSKPACAATAVIRVTP